MHVLYALLVEDVPTSAGGQPASLQQRREAADEWLDRVSAGLRGEDPETAPASATPPPDPATWGTLPHQVAAMRRAAKLAEGA